MSTMIGIRSLNRSAKFGVGIKDVVYGKTVYVNVEHKRVARELGRHSSIGQFMTVNPARYQLDTAIVTNGGSVTPRTASLVLDVNAANITYLDNVTTGTLAAGTATVVPDAANPLVAAIGIDTTTAASLAVATVINNTAAATITEARFQQLPGSLATLPAVDSTAARTWLALVWVPPRLASVTGVASTGVFTKSAHGLVVGDPVWFNAVTGATAGLTATTIYYVNTVPTTGTFTVSATPGGSTLTWTTDVSAGALQRQILASDVLDIRP